MLQIKNLALKMNEAKNQVTVTCTTDSLLIRISNIACTEPPSVEWNFSGKTIGGDDDERVQMDAVQKDGRTTNYEVSLRINKVNDSRSFLGSKHLHKVCRTACSLI